MKFIVHNTKQADSIQVSGDTIPEVRQAVEKEFRKRGWDPDDCYSTEIREDVIMRDL